MSPAQTYFKLSAKIACSEVLYYLRDASGIFKSANQPRHIVSHRLALTLPCELFPSDCIVAQDLLFVALLILCGVVLIITTSHGLVALIYMLRETCWVDGSEEARFFTLLIAVEEILNETRQCHLKDALKEILDQLLAFRAVWSRLIVQSLDDLDKLIDVHLLFIFLSRQNHLLNFD